MPRNEKARPALRFEFGDEAFEMLTQYTLQTNSREFAERRAVLLGFDPEKKIRVLPGAAVRVPLDQVGRNVTFGLYSYVNGDVTVGDNVLIGPHCSVTASNHAFDPATGWFSGRSQEKPVVLGDGSWLASGVTVTSGVRLGRCNLVCAGSVVTKSTEDYAIMAGAPAKKIGHIDKDTGEYVWYSRIKEEKP